MKHSRQIAWYILPTGTIFLVILGIQLLVGTAFAAFLFAFGTSEIGEVSTWRLVSTVLTVILYALLPSLGSLFLALIGDILVKNRPGWLKIFLPFPFILAVPIIVYVAFSIPYPEEPTWWSILTSRGMGLLVLVLLAFIPYWYILQTQRFVVWLLKKTKPQFHKFLG